MKTVFKFLSLIAFLISTYAKAQKIDWLNAPVNPIAFEYKLEHYNLKGDVYAYGKQMFSKDGFLIFENQFNTDSFLYKNNQLYADTSGRLFEFNAQGYISKMTYASLGVQTQNYTYNTKGLLTKVTNTKGYNATYEYDSSDRMIKSIIGNVVREYSYQKKGDELFVTIKDYSVTPAKQTISIYKNGHIIGTDTYKYDNKYDKNGNLISNYKGEVLYYSDIESKTSEISVIYNKPYSVSYDQLRDCKFYINDKEIKFIFKKALNKKDIMIYDPFKEKYLVVENAFEDSKFGKKQVFSKVYMNADTYLDLFEKFQQLCYKGTLLTNSLYLRKESLKVYSQFNNYICYDDFVDKTFYCKYDPNKKFTFYPLQELNSNENIFFIKSKESVIYAEKGKALVNSDYTYAYNNKDLVLFKNSQPLYYFPNYKNALDDTVYPGRLYNKSTDTYTLEKNTSTSNSDNKSTACKSGNCQDGYGEYITLNNTSLKGFFNNNSLNGVATQTFENGDNYIGNFVNGKKEGYGIYNWISTNTQYYGEWSNDKINGYGYLVVNNETTQAGIYTNGKLTTDLYTDYKNKKLSGGNCLGNCYNGYGAIKYDNGDGYTGFFSNGKEFKVGNRNWKSHNSFYVGQFDANGQTNGTGMYVDNYSVYFGEIKNGKLTGKAVKTNKSSGEETYGEFNNGTLVKDYSTVNSNTATNNNSSSTTITSSNCVSGNCDNGYGKLQFSDYSITGFFSNGKANGFVTVIFNTGDYYLGNYKNGLRDGYGIYHWNTTGNKYYGEWKEGYQHGYGYYQKAPTITEAGYYEKGKLVRNMLTQDFKNNKYVGNCKGNCNNGFGQFNFSDGSWFFGFFNNGQMHNIGIYKWAASGDVYIGQFYNGKITGQGQLSFGSNKYSYCGGFFNTQRQGLGVYMDDSRKEISKGIWENGTLKTSF